MPLLESRHTGQGTTKYSHQTYGSKCGYVYQAANFYYGGKYTTQVYLMENGEKLHPRSTKEILKENVSVVNKKYLLLENIVNRVLL